ncbi:MAG: diphthine--ammonia ligase [Methanospirillum sp.]|uniref:diphthine--ammonia ligase n=1 Tax=Methanospirillum sp. TaxID=45200 RepID=UPI0023760201|nr:diphthine--ammonia ligase [Methanospirillum sp.]MDD1728964.1 diphthine--ammonia ligase [Methanospirillum sp.]
MRLAVLLSGGKDSLYSCWKAMESDEVVCFVTIQSHNPESYMFHTPNIDLTRLQAEAAEIPLIEWQTEGLEEIELDDLEAAVKEAVRQYGVEGVVTGAIQSVYQAARVQRICNHLHLWSFNPLWLCDQENYLRDLIENRFEVIIAGVFSAPFDDTWLGRTIDHHFVDQLISIRDRYGISLTGEGGEYESFVCDAPFFTRRIAITDSCRAYKNHNGSFLISGAELVAK